ncbi:MAG: dicarboxylate/amino acid:cation symporter [Alphaproteobacteria bacterium]|nr:dicarboxylate/amino acid:cation symporter [Alphaproteobacteria bacterium]
MKLWKQVLIGLALGVIAGITLEKDIAKELKIFGTIFMNLIKMVIVPLIFFALLSGITSISGEGNFTRVGVKGFSAYILTAVFAVLIGITAGHVMKPGEGVNLQELIKQSESDNKKAFEDTLTVAKTNKTAKDFLIELIPTNPIKAMADDKYLQIIVFTIFLGIVINMIGEKAKPIKDIINSASAIFFKTIEIIIKLAPLGVFGYMAFSIADQGPEILHSLARLIFTVLLACLIQYVIFGFLIAFFARISPMPFYRKIFFTQSLAFSTSSSKATLPTAMTQLQERLGVSKTNSNFLMPLGVCINMDGTAIYLGICALFFAQGFGIDLTMQNYMMLILTCTLGSIGAAGIPSGSIIFMSMVLSSIGIPVEGIVVILGVDRVLDMVRTTINITGDSAITLIVDKTEGGLNEKIYHAKDV